MIKSIFEEKKSEDGDGDEDVMEVLEFEDQVDMNANVDIGALKADIKPS